MFELAERMSRLGTESAFEVLARARALEARAATSSTWRSASPISPRRRTSSRRPAAPCTRAGRTIRLRRASRSLRKLIAEQIGERRGQSIDPAQVVVTPGAKPIMFYVILALAEPGSEVIYPDPGFPIYSR